MPREPDERLLAMWREIEDGIRSGEIQGLFAVWEYDGPLPTGSACRAKDQGLLLQEVKRHALRAAARHARAAR